MSKMGICAFSDGCTTTDFVAPKSDYQTKQAFFEACLREFDYILEDFEEWGRTLPTVENVEEDYCRWYSIAPEGIDIDGGCYSFCKPLRGSFEVWRINIQII